nr:MAG TPA: hypothetical protein [Caudoviricetes sp.]
MKKSKRNAACSFFRRVSFLFMNICPCRERSSYKK